MRLGPWLSFFGVVSCLCSTQCFRHRVPVAESRAHTGLGTMRVLQPSPKLRPATPLCSFIAGVMLHQLVVGRVTSVEQPSVIRSAGSNASSEGRDLHEVADTAPTPLWPFDWRS